MLPAREEARNDKLRFARNRSRPQTSFWTVFFRELTHCEHFPMKTPFRPLVLAFLFAALGAAVASAQQPSRLQFPAPSPAGTLKQRVGITDIEISYARPSMRDRQVFGGLVPYGEVWRTGANNATKITFSTDVTFGGTKVPAGTYALFTIPEKDEWTVILNKNTQQWGSYRYDQKDDVARVKATATTVSPAVESFTIDLNDLRSSSATLNLAWDQTRVSVPIELDVVGVLVPKIEAAMNGEPKPNAGEYFQSALFFLEHELDLKKAAEWMDAAIAQQPNAFYMHYHKARLLAKMGDKAGARAAAEKSVELAKAAASGMGAAVADEYIRLNQNLMSSLGQ